MSRMKVWAWALAFVVLLAACSEETRGQIAEAVPEGVPSTVEGSPPIGEEAGDPAVDLPDVNIELQGPEPEPEPEEEGLSGEATALLLVIGALVLIILVLIGRRPPKPAPPPATAKPITPAPPPPASPEKEWGDMARMTYADARWILDNTSDEVVEWRTGRAGDRRDDASRIGVASARLDDRMTQTIDDAYRLEASAATLEQRDAARQLSAALTSVQSTFEARVAVPPTQAEITEADTRLSAARERLASALDRLTLRA